MKPTYVLGINAVFHESAAALLRNGRLLAFAEEERFNRIKHGKPPTLRFTGKLPWNAIDYCLRTAGLRLSEVNHFGYSFDPKQLLRDTVGSTGEKKVPLRDPREISTFYKKITAIQRAIAKRSGSNIQDRFFFVPHHLSHAAGSYYASGFTAAAVLVVDGIAEYSTAWLGKATGGRLSAVALAEIHFPHSLGLLWEKFAVYLGFSVYDAAKVMGLASYGRRDVFRREFDRLVRGRGGLFEVDNQCMRWPLPSLDGLEKLFGARARRTGQPIREVHQDIAAGLQKKTEQVLLALARTLRRDTGLTRLCMSGGVSLNCVANTKVFAKSGFRDIYIQPAAHDAGTALGAAYFVWRNILKRRAGSPLRHAYWGPEYTNREIRAVLTSSKQVFRKTSQIEVEVAKLLSEGNIVAWFQGRMETGPRALGNRSILADPRNAAIRHHLNAKVKFRELFRPLCPSVMAERAHLWFETATNSSSAADYMLMAVKVRSDKERIIPAVVHVDKTSRIQTVSRKANHRYYELLSEFERITGVPILLNTSFNIREPIVCSPDHALSTFRRSRLDYLAIGDYLVTSPRLRKVRPGQRSTTKA